MNRLDMCHASPLEIPSAILTLGMTSSMATGQQDIGTLAALNRKNVEKVKAIAITIQSAMAHLFVNTTAVHL